METLPSIKELQENSLVVKKEEKALTALLNQPPIATWVKQHPFIKNYNYIPIERVEYLLKSIFGRYRIEITGQGVAFNGVWVTVRVHYVNPINGEWDYHDGIGAAQLQTKSGSSPAELQNINNGALSMAYPIAKTVAIKDACDHFGKLFGSDLNRKDVIEYDDPQTLIPFERGHDKWQKAVESMAKGLTTIEKSKSYYNITEKGEQQLNEDIIKYKKDNGII